MLIEIHMIQNHSPANLNRDDLGAPKTCWFGGVLRSRISSQCLKRSIRMSEQFARLRGGVRTRQLAKLIAEQVDGSDKMQRRVEKVLDLCGIKQKVGRKGGEGDSETNGDKSKMLVYTTFEAITEMATMLRDSQEKDEKVLAEQFGKLISQYVAVPDIALSGRMLETGVIEGTTVDAALQVAHAFSTHAALPEVDYYVAADDIPGSDAGAGYVDEAMFASACFYKYFVIHWDQLKKNLNGNAELAAHTVAAFLQAAATVNPTGKQNSFAAHNCPDGIVVQVADMPCSYANAFARPVDREQRDLIEQSVAQLAQYMHDLDTGYGRPRQRFWFSPNQRYPLTVTEGAKELQLAQQNFSALGELLAATVSALGYDLDAVQQIAARSGVQG